MRVQRHNSTLSADTDKPLRRNKQLARTELQRKPPRDNTGRREASSLKRSTATRVPGYDYSAFCEGIADRDGCDCWVRRNVSLPPEAVSCDGRLDGHHLLSKEWIKEHERTMRLQWLQPFDLGAVLSDSRNGRLMCRKHHDLLENARIVIARADLPACVEEFAAELGDRALARLERDYGLQRGGGVAGVVRGHPARASVLAPKGR